mgnify:CR=1 FL=1
MEKVSRKDLQAEAEKLGLKFNTKTTISEFEEMIKKASKPMLERSRPKIRKFPRKQKRKRKIRAGRKTRKRMKKRKRMKTPKMLRMTRRKTLMKTQTNPKRIRKSRLFSSMAKRLERAETCVLGKRIITLKLWRFLLTDRALRIYIVKFWIGKIMC